MIVNVCDLVGKDIQGKRADIRHRVNGEVRYQHQKDPIIVKLEKAFWEQRDADEIRRGIGDGDWLELEWEGQGHNQPTACGFSGLCDYAQALAWQIELLDPI